MSRVIPGAGYTVLDIETTTHTSFKRKANPFDPRNWIVMVGWRSQDDDKPVGHRLTALSRHAWWFIPLLRKSRLLVGHNIKFDLLHILKDPECYDAWQDWVAEGGNLWDTQLGEYLLDGQRHRSHMMSLNEVLQRRGHETKVDEVAALWEAGVQTDDIDPDLLSRYLLGEDLIDPLTKQPTGRRREGDIGLTQLVFLEQVAEAKQRGQARSIMLNNGALIATIEMERNGMFVDKAKGLVLAEALRQKLAGLRAELSEFLPKDLPFEFNWTNRYHLSPLIFGGEVKYEVREYDLVGGEVTTDPPTEKARSLYVHGTKEELHYLLADGTTMEVARWDSFNEIGLAAPGGDFLAPREVNKSGKNAGEAKTKKVKVPDYDKPKGRMSSRLLRFPGFVEPEREWASSTPGLYSVASEVIETLTARKDIPFLVTLGKVSALAKDLGTYFIIKDEKTGVETGMLTLVDALGLVHHSLNMTSTVTARFSSSNPNLQNVPKGNKSEAKTLFVSRFGDDGEIGQSDFSSLEVYVQAILTRSSNLILDLLNGIDLHVMRLSLKEGMPYDEVYALCKGDKYTEEWDYKRTDAKVFSFQRAYGAGAKKIAKSTGMNIEDVEALIAAEQARYPEVDRYFDKRTQEIGRNRVPGQVVVPHPLNAAIMVRLGESHVNTPDGKRYSYVESTSPEYLLKKGITSSFSPTEIKNYEVQGTGGEWMKAALWLMVREFYRNKNFGGLALLVNTVHDAAYTDMHKSVKPQAAATMHACMLAASDFMAWYFNWDIPLPVPTDTVSGPDMATENKFSGPEWVQQTEALRNDLRVRYMQGFVPRYSTKEDYQ